MYTSEVNGGRVDASSREHGVGVPSSGSMVLDQYRLHCDGVPAANSGSAGVPPQPVEGAVAAELRSNPDMNSHPLAAHVAFRLMAEHGGL